jgi:hypothetical protein
MLCDPFGDDCAADEHCVADLLNPTLGYGFCLERGQAQPTTQPFGACETPDTACADRGFCVEFVGGQTGCYMLCDPTNAANSGCPGTSQCSLSFRDPDTGEEVDLSVGEYGVCLP